MFTASSPSRNAMNARFRGIIGGFCSGGAPRPSGAGSTRQPGGCEGAGLPFGGGVCGVGLLSAGESGGKISMYSGAGGPTPHQKP
jgi:hypothetical protein